MTEETVNINGKSLNFYELQVEFIELESKIDNYTNWIACLNNKCEELIDTKTRLEQENKELKKEVKQIGSDFIKKGDYARELEKENKELKEAKDKYYQQILDDEILFNNLKEENEELKAENKYYKARLKLSCNELDKSNNWQIAERREKNKYRSALEEILESAKFAQCLPCGSGNLEDCLNCDDDTTNNGQFCMEKRIHDIKTKCVEVLNYSEG